MAEISHIEWTDATWNPVTGCSVVSPGCIHCYAMRLAGTRLKHHPSRAGLTADTKAGPVWTGEVRLNEQWLDQPLRWARSLMIFVCAHGDLFHESVPDAWIDRVFAVMALAPQHTFQVLTKRSARMRAYLSNGGPTLQQLAEVPQVGRDVMVANTDWPLPNVWLGVSAERQQEADDRIPDLLATPAAVRFVSLEPLLGPIDLRHLQPADPPVEIDSLNGTHGVLRPHLGRSPRLSWVIVGGESGPDARPMHPDWARDLRDQCAAADVPFFFKQWGSWAPGECAPFLPTRTQRTADFFGERWTFGTLTPKASEEMHRDDEPDLYWLGKKAAGRLLDGIEHSAMPRAASTSPLVGEDRAAPRSARLAALGEG